MDNAIKEKLSKIYELVNKGATEGERNAAKAALDRMLAKYNLTAALLETIGIRQYAIKYSSMNELYLLNAIAKKLMGGLTEAHRRTLKYAENCQGVTRCREYVFSMNYLQYVEVSCSFEYFKRHMNNQFKLTVKPLFKRFKSKATREKLRVEFLTTYIIASKLYCEGDLTKAELSPAEYKRRSLLNSVKGGSYSTQIQSSHLLNG